MNAYDKLRPSTEAEICTCDQVQSLLLLDLLTDNPIHCGECRKEVDPERLHLSDREVDDIASWYSTASALYHLWLNSGAYEDYAKRCLIDPNGEVNKEGQRLARVLSKRLPTRYWMFSDTEDGEPIHCPLCKAELNTDVTWGTGYCQQCSIHM